MVTKETSSTLVFPAFRLHALHDAARVLSRAYGDEYDVSKDSSAELAGITEISEEEAWLCAQAWRFQQTFEARAEQHFYNRLVENERNVAEEMRQEVGANHAKIESAFEAAVVSDKEPCARRCARDPKARCSFAKVTSEWNNMPVSNPKCLQRHWPNRRIASSFSVEDSIVCWTLYRFLRVTMKSSLRLCLLLEIVDMSNEVCHNSHSLHKKVYTAPSMIIANVLI